MIKLDEDALICDLAETYGIHDYRSYPLGYIATLAHGLRDSSRIKMKLEGQELNLELLLLAGIHDRLTLLLYSNTEDARKGKNYPKLIMDTLKNKDNDILTFSSSEDFEKKRGEIIGRSDTR